MLPINRSYNKIQEERKRKRFGEKKNLLNCNCSPAARVMAHTVQLLRHDAYTVQLYCPIHANS